MQNIGDQWQASYFVSKTGRITLLIDHSLLDRSLITGFFFRKKIPVDPAFHPCLI